MCVYYHFHDGLSEDINAIVYALRLWAVENYDPTGIHSRPKPTVTENKNLSSQELRPGAPNKKAWNKFRESWWRKMQPMGLQWTTKFDIQDRVVIWRGRLDDKSKNCTGRGIHDYISIGGPTFAEQTIELIKTEIWTRDIEKAMSGLKLMSMKDWEWLDRIDDEMQGRYEQAEKRKNKNKNKNKRRKENKKNKKAAESSAVPKNGKDAASEGPREGHETTGRQEPKTEGFHTDEDVVNEDMAEPENLIKTGDGDKALEAKAALLTTDNEVEALSEEKAGLEIRGWLNDIAILGNYQIPGIIQSQQQATSEEKDGLEIGDWLDEIATLGNYQIPAGGIIQSQKHRQDQQTEFTPQVTDREEEAQNKQQQAGPETTATQEAEALRQKLEEVEAKLAQAKSREATLTQERNEAEREAARAIHAFLEANEKAEQQHQKHGEDPNEFSLWAKEALPWPPIAEAPPQPAKQPHTLEKIEEELTKDMRLAQEQLRAQEADQRAEQERKRREEVEAELDLGYRHKLQGFEFVKKLNLEYHEQKEKREEAEERLASLREEATVTREVWKHVAALREMFSNDQIEDIVKRLLDAAKKSEMHRLGIKADLPEEVLEGIRGESEVWLEEEMGRVGESVTSAVRVWVREEIKLAVFAIQMKVKERIEEEDEKDVVEKRGPRMAWRVN
ncbi:hypothetical protein HYALB_00005699 [Hymenoscyphus albidus]|uniref:Uncharacterized protein n=1 Tax=Hymenoscyphus albidus TaxID=595503 RepID=A0A9N9LM96_9HELO|nr:hypothetical protein HYALB_00005699 [Hymenoscyphus albidus]